VAEHFGERLDGPCGACDVCAPPPWRARRPSPAPLPEDVGAAIVAAVGSLTWPLGRRSLAQALRGSPKAPPSARRSPAFGSLAAATEAEVTRWIRSLEAAGVLVERETESGFRVLGLVPGATVPSLRGRRADASHGDGDEPLFDALRAWRTSRSRADGVPAYVVLHDATLRELAASRPSTLAELAGVTGMGPVKVERYGDDVLAVLAAS
jgi:ATP-dependent DNA helicase RecQ